MPENDRMRRGEAPLPDIRKGQRWFLPSNPRKPARTVIEISEATGWVEYADLRGERRWCLVSSLQTWAMRYKAWAA